MHAKPVSTERKSNMSPRERFPSPNTMAQILILQQRNAVGDSRNHKRESELQSVAELGYGKLLPTDAPVSSAASVPNKSIPGSGVRQLGYFASIT
jgi:hypothetical protein